MQQVTLTLKVEEAAAVLGISRTTAYDLVARGQIPSIRLGNRIVIPKYQLDVMLKGNTGKDFDGS